MCSLGFKKSLSKVTVPVKCLLTSEQLRLFIYIPWKVVGSIPILNSEYFSEFFCPHNYIILFARIWILDLFAHKFHISKNNNIYKGRTKAWTNERNDVRPAMLMTHRKILFFFCDREHTLGEKKNACLLIENETKTDNVILVVRYVPRPRANSFLVFSGNFNKWLSDAVALFTTLSSDSIKVNCTIVLYNRRPKVLRTDTILYELICRWNLVDLVIVILSLAGIIIESLSSSNKLLINPTVARSLRVLRIIRGL